MPTTVSMPQQLVNCFLASQLSTAAGADPLWRSWGLAVGAIALNRRGGCGLGFWGIPPVRARAGRGSSVPSPEAEHLTDAGRSSGPYTIGVRAAGNVDSSYAGQVFLAHDRPLAAMGAGSGVELGGEVSGYISCVNVHSVVSVVSVWFVVYRTSKVGWQARASYGSYITVVIVATARVCSRS